MWEKVFLRSHNRATVYVLAQKWAQNWNMLNLIFIVGFVSLLCIFWYVTSNMWENVFLRSHNWATVYVLAQKWAKKLKYAKFDILSWFCVPLAHILICHQPYIEKHNFNVPKLGYQVCFGSKWGSKLQYSKFDIHSWICVPFVHILIWHKQYVEKKYF